MNYKSLEEFLITKKKDRVLYPDFRIVSSQIHLTQQIQYSLY